MTDPNPTSDPRLLYLTADALLVNSWINASHYRATYEHKVKSKLLKDIPGKKRGHNINLHVARSAMLLPSNKHSSCLVSLPDDDVQCYWPAVEDWA